MAGANSPKQGVGPRLSPNHGQSLTMTPSLQQALQLMAMRLGEIRKFALDLAVATTRFFDVQVPSLPAHKSPD